jgi:flagellar basal body-associated protein FliL
MKPATDRQLRILSSLYRGLIVLFLFLGLVFLAGTIYGVFFNNVPPIDNQTNVLQKNEEGHIFTGIGRLRISTMDAQPGTVILFVSFVYYPDDKAFSEELALRVGDFRDIVKEYIAAFSVSELRNLSEESMKIELMRRFNAVLRLGKIGTLYFSDFMIVG